MKYSLIDRMRLVSSILVRYDPMGLIKDGAPPDEYEHEAVNIVRNIARDWRIDEVSLTDVEYWCFDVFEEQFGSRLAKPIVWGDIAREILEAFK